MEHGTAGQAGPRVFTIGHSTRGFDEVLAMLRSNEVTKLVDVRSYPASRKFPQWNRAAIEDALPADIGYRWIRDLGGRRHTPAGVDSPNGGCLIGHVDMAHVKGPRPRPNTRESSTVDFG